MAFQPINFANIAPQGNPFLRDFVDSLVSGYKSGQVPAQLERERQKEELANAFQKLKVEQEPKRFQNEQESVTLANAFQKFLNQEQPQKFGSEMATALANRLFNQANINKINTMTPLEAKELALKNQFYPEKIKADIESSKALSNIRAFGGTGLGAGGREEALFQNLIAKDNPNLSPQQVYEAANAVREGKDTLSDGTKINKMSPAARSSFDRLTKYGSTGSLVTQGVVGQQAEKEIGVLSKYISDAIAPYGNTIAGYSPKQIMDTFSSNKNDQINLGRLVAAQTLQTDLAAVQNRLNSSASTASITNEILNRSEGIIKTTWPRMSNIARQESLRYIKEALEKGFEARRKVNIGASSINKPENIEKETSEGEMHFNPKTGRLE